MKYITPLVLAILWCGTTVAHDGHSHAPSPLMKRKIEQLNTGKAVRLIAAPVANAPLPTIADVFKPFASKVTVRSDQDFVYVESTGMPDHPMMIGITAWQQQVPIPQSYTGTNAWRIPLHPVPAQNPMSAKDHFFRGAIALAANGVPIFNPIKNDGKTDTLVAGELDQWGGHCGRADDYHYHIAPVHLEKIVGAGNPLAVALDGYLIYGYDDPNGEPPTDLDWLNGHKGPDGEYHYHATKTYPYLNGGFYGEVVELDGQVDPQPRAQGVRPALPGLRGAKITGFENPKPASFVVRYDISGEQRSIQYSIATDGTATFNFVSPQGTQTETYTRRQGGGGGGNGRRNAEPPPGPNQREPRPNDSLPNGPPPSRGNGKRPPQNGPIRTETPQDLSSMSRTNVPGFEVASASVDEKHLLSVECTCDGTSQSPAVSWTGAPEGTKSFVLSVWHTAPDQEKSYWVVYNIPANVTELKQNSKGVGIVGLNDKRRAEYDPMCSKGPGVKKYHITIFALSSELKFTAEQATRSNLLKAVKDIVLGESTLDFLYER